MFNSFSAPVQDLEALLRRVKPTDLSACFTISRSISIFTLAHAEDLLFYSGPLGGSIAFLCLSRMSSCWLSCSCLMRTICRKCDNHCGSCVSVVMSGWENLWQRDYSTSSRSFSVLKSDLCLRGLVLKKLLLDERSSFSRKSKLCHEATC